MPILNATRHIDCKDTNKRPKNPSLLGEGLGRGCWGEALRHTARYSQRCAQCCEDTYQYLNHHFPF